MPNYDYTCQACGHQLVQFQKISDIPLKTCPKCHKDHLVRGPGGGIALHFQGSGFYITDYNKTSSSSPQSKTCCPCGKGDSCSS